MAAIVDDRTLEKLCSSFDNAINLSQHHAEIVAVAHDLNAPMQESESGETEGISCSVDKYCASNSSEETYEIQTTSKFLKIENLNNSVQVLKKERDRLRNEVKSIFNSFPDVEAFTALQHMSEEHELLRNKCQEECGVLKKKYLEECYERKKLYNEVIELKGNIRVFCRNRPLKEDEIANGSTSVLDHDSCQENELQIICSDSSRKQFKFDHVFRPEDDQEAVFLQTLPVVTSVLDGYNVCIFAYGQTGTGKTYTMEGTHENRGVNYRTLEELFRLIEKRSSIIKYELCVSMLEVYNEKIRDLLIDDSNQPDKRLEIKQSAEGTQEVPGLVEARVYNTEEVWRLLRAGSQARSVGSTNANELSSRSHCLLRVTIVGENLVNGVRTRSHLWLVDLAGSERVSKTEVEGERLKESQFINKSLSALGDVISALASKTSHVPYRNSKLTHLLQSSLGGDCKTLMFVQISPNAADLAETLCSLNFASRVRGVEHGPARRQTDHGELLKYKQLVEKAKHDEKETKKLQDNVQSLQLRLTARESVCRNLQEKVRELENQLAEERKIRLKQENRALATSTSMDKKPPLAPSKLRPPLRKITNNIPVPSPAPTLKNTMSILPAVNEERKEDGLFPLSLNERKEKSSLQARRGSIAMRPPPPPPATTTGHQTFLRPRRRASVATLQARRGSIAVRPLPPPPATTTGDQTFRPRRRASVATLQPELNSTMKQAPSEGSSSSIQPRIRRFVGRQSYVWDPQKLWRTSRVPSPLQQQQQQPLNELTSVGLPSAASSSKFRGSPPSQWKPTHPTVVALQRKKQLVWSPLKLKAMKSKRNSLMY
ncbi:kinesin-like protein KIN-14S [Andrographis paniculata]|uniref:kinesin-like protein KIN-14S n=1 Tax=Andrographis paniculata TaxID=175694 RepID=UPI0021E90C0E|nr:kinesin-like protein KIN-14S [Andrographis paniculata]XP_051144569.1 kinesin-like protein KIN-14S [Andrographis paniculata]